MILIRSSHNFRTSSNLPGRVTKHGSFTKHSHAPSPKNHMKYGREKREKTEKNLVSNHPRHRKISKTRSHTTHRSSRNEGWDDFNQFDFNPNHLQNQMKQSLEFQNSNKTCLHATKSDFNEKICEHNVPERHVGALPGINVPKISSKQPLKKSNTFPYEKLHSDTTSYSSSENESIGCEKSHKDSNVHNLDFKNSNEKEEHFDEDVFANHSNHVRKR